MISLSIDQPLAIIFLLAVALRVAGHLVVFPRRFGFFGGRAGLAHVGPVDLLKGPLAYRLHAALQQSTIQEILEVR